jgi:hypothetical protein
MDCKMASDLNTDGSLARRHQSHVMESLNYYKLVLSIVSETQRCFA